MRHSLRAKIFFTDLFFRNPFYKRTKNFYYTLYLEASKLTSILLKSFCLELINVKQERRTCL
jgi:hypothetical protein